MKHTWRQTTPDGERKPVGFVNEHVPMSCSLASNVPGYEGPTCLVSPSPQDLVTKMVTHLNEISRTAYDLHREMYEGVLLSVSMRDEEEEGDWWLGLLDEVIASCRVQQCQVWFMPYIQVPDIDIERPQPSRGARNWWRRWWWHFHKPYLHDQEGKCRGQPPHPVVACTLLGLSLRFSMRGLGGVFFTLGDDMSNIYDLLSWVGAWVLGYLYS